MKELIGKTLGNVSFFEREGIVFANVKNSGVSADYEIREVKYKAPCEAILMDLDGTTLTSEEFWVFIIEETMKKLMDEPTFKLEEADIPFVSGFTTADHLTYCINKYAKDKNLNDAIEIYHRTTEYELGRIMKGEGHVEAFTPAEGLKEFLLGVKKKGIKIGLVTSGLDYKAIPEIVAVFKTLDMGNPLDFYDTIITGGRRKDVGDYGTLGEIVSKPHPWLYTETAYMGLKINNPDHVLGIEDSAAGAIALRIAGFPVIGLECGNIGDSGLDSICERKVAKLTDILEML